MLFFVFKKFPIGLKQNLREEDNLSTRDTGPVPNVSFVRRFTVFTMSTYVPVTSKKISRRKPTINTSPMIVPTAIPAMAPGDKPGRAMVAGGVAVGGEVRFQYTCHADSALKHAV